MERLTIGAAITAGILLGGCGDDGENNNSGNSNVNSNPVLAPASVVGKTFDLLISSGSGVLANTGRAVVEISNSGNTYSLVGDGINIGGSEGIYSYTANGSSGQFSFDDSALGQGLFEFVYNTDTSGSFLTTVVIDQEARQSGTFIQSE